MLLVARFDAAVDTSHQPREQPIVHLLAQSISAVRSLSKTLIDNELSVLCIFKYRNTFNIWSGYTGVIYKIPLKIRPDGSAVPVKTNCRKWKILNKTPKYAEFSSANALLK